MVCLFWRSFHFHRNISGKLDLSKQEAYIQIERRDSSASFAIPCLIFAQPHLGRFIFLY
jgi:hypothetical protein